MRWVRYIVACLIVALLVASVALNVRYYIGGNDKRIVADTIKETIYDTIPYYKPVLKDSLVINYITEKLPAVVKCDSDSIGVEKVIPDSVEKVIPDSVEKVIPDSVEVEIPITQKIYEDSLYKAFVSGYRQSLDSLIIYSPKEVVTVTNIKPKRWGIGIQVGYGFTPEGAHPYIGVGISCNIFSF